MTVPQTTSPVKGSGTNGVNGAFPADVLAFAVATESRIVCNRCWRRRIASFPRPTG